MKKLFAGKQKKVGDAATDEDNLETATIKLDNDKASDLMSVNFGEIAALQYSLAKVRNEIQSINKVKIPHMVYEQLRWIVSRPNVP